MAFVSYLSLEPTDRTNSVFGLRSLGGQTCYLSDSANGKERSHTWLLDSLTGEYNDPTRAYGRTNVSTSMRTKNYGYVVRLFFSAK